MHVRDSIRGVLALAVCIKAYVPYGAKPIAKQTPIDNLNVYTIENF